MNPINFNNIEKILSQQQSEKTSVSKKSDTKFSDILSAELAASATKGVTTTDNIMPLNPLLNIKSAENDDIFITKGLDLCSQINNILSDISSAIEDNKDIKSLFGKLSQTSKELNNISENVTDENVKNLIDRAVFTSNIEIEKYLKGDYLL